MGLYNDLTVTRNFRFYCRGYKVSATVLLQNYGENNTWTTEKIKKWCKTMKKSEKMASQWSRVWFWALWRQGLLSCLYLFLQNLEHCQTLKKKKKKQLNLCWLIKRINEGLETGSVGPIFSKDPALIPSIDVVLHHTAAVIDIPVLENMMLSYGILGLYSHNIMRKRSLPNNHIIYNNF